MRLHRSAATLLAVLSAAAGAQQAPLIVAGTVRDSASRQPLAGVVVSLQDARGTVWARRLTLPNGAFRLEARSTTTEIHVQRIGFRPRTLPIPSSAAAAARLDIAMVSIPTMLEPVRSVASGRCPRRPDAASTAALLDQARAGLLAVTVARESNPPAVTLLAYQRELAADRDSVVSQRVRVESIARAASSFNAAHTAKEFVERGFLSDSGGRQTFFGPDADVLLDQDFGAGYCFHVETASVGRAGQIGLGFAPVAHKSGRVAVVGTLWIDTLGRALRDIEFKFIDFNNRVVEGLGTGGTVRFQDTGGGVVLIDRWSFRLIGAADTIRITKTGRTSSSGFAIAEAGGELARASWPDGREWVGSLGAIDVTAISDRPILPGTFVTLTNSGYRALVDAAGHAVIRDVLPGPYDVAVIDPRFRIISMPIMTSVTLIAHRDSTTPIQFRLPTAESFLDAVCPPNRPRGGETSSLVARVYDSGGFPADSVQWHLNGLVGGSWKTLSRGGVTGSSGVFYSCGTMRVGQTVQVEARRQGARTEIVTRRIDTNVTVVPILLHATLARLPGDTSTARAGSTLRGAVVDSATGAPVAGAYVSLLGAERAAVSDSAGRFMIDRLQRGEYTAEVHTWSLDSLGVVSQSAVVVGDSTAEAQLRVPSLTQAAGSLCSASVPRGKDDPPLGVLAGAINMRGGGPLPEDVRVVAEWSDSATRADTSGARARWIEARADARGAFRLCGVPLNSAIVVRAEAEGLGTIPADVRISPDAPFLRTELILDPQILSTAVFTGRILADSTKLPLAGADVSFPQLTKGTVTNDRGTFRVSGIPTGSHQVRVRRVGYAPLDARLTFANNQTVERQIFLERFTMLDSVAITEKAGGRLDTRAFEERRARGSGVFVLQDEIAKRNVSRLSELLRDRRGVIIKRVATGGNGVRFTQYSSRPLDCAPEIWIDGHRMAGLEIDDVEALNVRAIELYANMASVPFEFTPRGNQIYCGTIAIWQK